jgi:radical SAM superfamily enzyme YgiQ (UPF0313 family)
MVMVGVESGAARIQDLIKKGITTGQATEALKNFHQQGIWTHCFLMMGLPTETFEEVNQTINFLCANGAFIDSVGLSEFAACRGTPILPQLQELQVEIAENSNNRWLLHFTQLRGKILTRREKAKLLMAYTESLNSLDTDANAWLQLHVNHLFLEVAVMGRDSLSRKRTRKDISFIARRTTFRPNVSI